MFKNVIHEEWQHSQLLLALNKGILQMSRIVYIIFWGSLAYGLPWVPAWSCDCEWRSRDGDPGEIEVVAIHSRQDLDRGLATNNHSFAMKKRLSGAQGIHMALHGEGNVLEMNQLQTVN